MRRQAIIAVAAIAALAAGAGAVQATTGPTQNLPKPDVHIPVRVSQPYIGHWVIDQVAAAARVDSGQIALDYTKPPGAYLIGNITLRYYDKDGRASSFLANLYPFSQTSKGVRANILSQASLAKIGAVTMERPHGDHMNGTITLDGRTYKLVYKAKSMDAVVNAQPPPKARPLGGASPSQDDSTTSTTPAQSGDEVPADAGAATGLYAPLVKLAYELS